MSFRPLRILMVSHTWLGANDYSYVRAFRRAGHSVSVVSDEGYFASNLTNPWLRAARRVSAPLMAADYQKALLTEAAALQPHLFFVFKGTNVKADTVAAIKSMGAIAINFYPDVGIKSESPNIAHALPVYDWVFTSKSFRVLELKRSFGAANASFLPHAYDPEVHVSLELDADDFAKYTCDVGFVGTWSPKKERILAAVMDAMPSLGLKIWGNQWDRARSSFGGSLMRRPANGLEYAKAMRGSAICLALLVEAPSDSASGDLTTARTFEIPAMGGFMLHERTSEAEHYFAEGKECAMFDDVEEMISKIVYYLPREEERREIANAAYLRSVRDCHSYDFRAATIASKACELLAARDVSVA